MEWFKVTTVSICLMLASGCTTTPDKYKSMGELPAQTAVNTRNAGDAKASAVAEASVGVPQVYVDPQLGTSVELVVQSEYFSANGRTCRRYAMFTDGQSIPGVSCKDDLRGWIDLPLSSFVR